MRGAKAPPKGGKMKINKRLLSFFLAVLMVFTTFGETVFAVSSSIDTKREKPTTEIEGRVEGNKEVFSFDLEEIKEEEAPKLEKRSLFRMMPFADRSTQDRADQGDTTVKVTATGLNGGKFNWDALPNKEFKITAHWTTTDGETHTKDLTPAITKADTFNYTVGWPVDGTMKGNASLVVDFYQDVKVRVLAAKSTSTPDGAKGLKFEIDLMELAEPRADVKYVDPYGRPLEKADLPAADATMPKVTAGELGTDVSVDLPKESGQINMRESEDIDEFELNAAENGLTFKVDGKGDQEKIKIDEKEYLVDISQPNPKEIGQILMVSQPDVVVPPTGDDGQPVEVADGYVRVTFDPTDKAQNKTKTVYDVKKRLTWEQAKAATPAVAEPKAPTPKDETNKFVAWLDNTAEEGKKKLSEKDGNVAETTFTADYEDKYTSDPVIPFEPKDPEKPGDKDDENIPTENPEDNKPIKRDEYVVVGFKVDPKDSGTLTLGKQENKAVISALVKKDTEWAKFTMPTTNDGNDYVFWHWDKAPAEKVADGQVRVAKFIKSGDEIDPNDKNPLPNGFHKVTVAKGTGIADDALFGKTYAVKEGDTLAKAKFPELKVTDAKQYKNPTWNVENPWTVAVEDEDLTFTANAVSAVFDKDNVTDMVVKTQPKLNYVEGNATEGKLDLSKLVVELTDKNGNKQDVPFEKLGEYGITPNPANGTELTVEGNNGKPVELTKDKLTANTDNLVVTKEQTPQSEKPTVKQPTEGDEKITGTGIPGSKIVVKDSNGDEIGSTTVKPDKTWEVTVPGAEPLVKDEEIVVTQTETGKSESEKETATVKGKEESDKPIVNQPTEGDDKITGEGKPGAKIVVKDKDGNVIGETEVNDKDEWEVKVPEDKPLNKDDKITVEQTEKGKKPNTEDTTVKGKETPTPQEPSVTYPDTNIDKGETKRVTPDIKGKDGKTTTPESTPEVSQPGHGLIVTPNKDGSIDVTVPKDYDGPGTITVDVTVRVDGKDINTTLTIKVNSGDDSHRPEHDGGDIFDGLFKRHDYTPTYPVKTVVPEKTKEINKLWYIFHIDEYDYEEVRNYNSTSHKMDVTPVIRNERTMLPLRYVAEAINADVIWNAETRTATFTKDGLTASIQIDSDEIVLSNGKTVKMDSKPLNINDRILVSVVNVANVFGLTNGNTLDGVDQDIEWDHDTRTATIYIRR